MTTVLAMAPAFLPMAPKMFGSAFLSARVVDGRAYVLVRGDVRDPLAFVDPTDDELLLEAQTFPTTEEANAWIAADVAERGRPA